MKEVFAPISPSELFNKLSVLRVTSLSAIEPTEPALFKVEEERLRSIADTHIPMSQELRPLLDQLHEINIDLISVRYDIAQCEHHGDFGPAFIALARAEHATRNERNRVLGLIDNSVKQ